MSNVHSNNSSLYLKSSNNDSFANKNIDSSSNQIDQFAIFTKFITKASETDKIITEREVQFLKTVTPNQQKYPKPIHISNTSKQMIRLFGRVIQIIQNSIQKTQGSLFSQNGRLKNDYGKFKKNLHKIIQQNPVEISQFSKVIVNFGKNKYKRQLTRIKKYVDKIKEGQHVSLRDMYSKLGSDASSPDEKHKIQKKVQIKPDLKQMSEYDEQIINKKVISKRPQASKARRSLSKRKQKQQNSTKNKQQINEVKMQKSATANLLLKFYSVMQLNKKQFLQDYIYEKNQQQKQKKRIMSQLLQRNRLNSQQINEYTIRCQAFNPTTHVIANSSDQNTSKQVQRNDSSVNSKNSKTSFLIYKRKPSFTFQSPSQKSDVQIIKNQIPFSKTNRNLSRKKKSSQQKTARQTNKSKKILVAKSPVVFQDDIIQKAQITRTGWAQAPLTGKQKGRKNESLRIKRRNYPYPMQQKFQSQTFRFTQNPY